MHSASNQCQPCESPVQSSHQEGREQVPSFSSRLDVSATQSGLSLNAPWALEQRLACGSEPSQQHLFVADCGAQPQGSSTQEGHHLGQGLRDAFSEARFCARRLPPSHSPHDALGPTYWFSKSNGAGRQIAYKAPVENNPDGRAWKPSRDAPARTSAPQPLMVVGSNPGRHTSANASVLRSSGRLPPRHATPDGAAMGPALTTNAGNRRPQTSMCVRERGAMACAHCGNPGDAQESVLAGVWGATKHARPSHMLRPMTAPVQQTLDMYAASCR
jgi:hypothetical protein